MVGGAGHVETLRAADPIHHLVDLAAGSALVKDGDALSNAFARVHFAGVWIGGYNKHAYNNNQFRELRKSAAPRTQRGGAHCDVPCELMVPRFHVILKYFLTKLYYQISHNSNLHVSMAETSGKLEEVIRLMAQSNLDPKPDSIDRIIKKMEKHKEDFAKRRERERRKNRGLIGGKSKRVKSKRNKRSTKRRNARK